MPLPAGRLRRAATPPTKICHAVDYTPRRDYFIQPISDYIDRSIIPQTIHRIHIVLIFCYWYN
jgi:hypothetical protein